ncbi:DsbA family oxidoreductase [Cohaesibacter intestini]|uniref:DsbA family oxidoreductase n=1 Tax=Cohaesibacter intestini TaxID=2211145 RepID=UPI000DE94B7C|nr:DsbA family oxidoreductase [Cohaesibacter intestini]
MTDPLRIDIISDVVCPWCAVGYNQLRVALERTGVEADIHWHPYQLNPDMGPEGQERLGYLAEKYGISADDAAKTQQRITDLGKEVGFTFNFAAGQRTYNTLAAHQLIHWARDFGKAHDLKLALLKAYFTDGKNIDDTDILVDIASDQGLDADEARAVLAENRFASDVGEHISFWRQQGISGVPAIILNSKYLLNGAAGVDQFRRALNAAEAERALA